MKTEFRVIFSLVVIILMSCKNSSNQNGNELIFTPVIENSDRIIKCYHRGGIGEDIVTGTYRAMPLGNILITENEKIKALQIRYADGRTLWHEVTYFSIDNTNRSYYCEKTGLTFSRSAQITYKNLEAESVGFESNINEEIFWN